MKTRAYVLGIFAGIFGILIAGGILYTVENHHATFTTGAAKTSSATNQTTSNQATGNVPKRPKEVVGKQLTKQQTKFKAILPSYLPKGYKNYTVRLENYPKGYAHSQNLWLYYKGPKKYQFFSVLEFPYPNHKLPAIFKLPAGKPVPNNIKAYAIIDGTYVFGPGPFSFVSHGLNFTINSSGNSSGDTMKFIKSLIKGGKPFN